MRLYLINPSNPLVSIVRVKEFRWNRYRLWKPLSLMVLAGLTPREWDISILDENLGTPDYAAMPWPDPVGLRRDSDHARLSPELQLLQRHGVQRAVSINTCDRNIISSEKPTVLLATACVHGAKSMLGGPNDSSGHKGMWTQGLRNFQPILKRWTTLVCNAADAWHQDKEPDCPWWYNERASVGYSLRPHGWKAERLLKNTRRKKVRTRVRKRIGILAERTSSYPGVDMITNSKRSKCGSTSRSPRKHW